MKHAYLIIAHNEFEILQLLVSKLDDESHDIYVHIDKKVGKVVELSSNKSKLFILPNRIDVRWGNVSQIKTELMLFEEACKNGPYDYYHLISGTHLPIKKIDEIHKYFEQLAGNCLFCNLEQRNGDYQEILKLHRINLCTRGYASVSKFVSGMSQFIWKAFIAIQRWLGISINNSIQFYWANNWCSLPQEAVDYLLSRKNAILKHYRWSFCGDEWFAPTELMASSFKTRVINSEQLLYGTIGKSNAPVLTMADAENLVNSDCCFGRKFTSDSKELISFLKIND